ncbi:MAG: SMI1/KNR4 family protein [Proteobacteria bacterium]|nr:MAG: SMI1/KNR4 family protein [Pseudomonadota bacterium]
MRVFFRFELLCERHCVDLNPQVTFIPSAIVATEEQVEAFEKQIGFKFPKDYRAFLLRFNGPEMKPSDPAIDPSDFYLTMDLSNLAGFGETKFCDVSSWSGFADPAADYQYGIVEEYAVTSGAWRLPTCLVPIAKSVGPAKIYLSLAAGQYGHVLLVGDEVINRQSDELEIRTTDFVTFATSFTEFVAKLKWVDPDIN